MSGSLKRAKRTHADAVGALFAHLAGGPTGSATHGKDCGDCPRLVGHLIGTSGAVAAIVAAEDAEARFAARVRAARANADAVIDAVARERWGSVKDHN